MIIRSQLQRLSRAIKRLPQRPGNVPRTKPVEQARLPQRALRLGLQAADDEAGAVVLAVGDQVLQQPQAGGVYGANRTMRTRGRRVISSMALRNFSAAPKKKGPLMS